jgi:Dna[CI] antecedent DciA-like protein
MNRSMEHAAAGLERIVANSLHRAPAEEAPMLAWPLACGPAVAERTHALGCAQGVLRVQVPDVGWRNELQALAPRYLAALNRYVSVQRIEFVVAAQSK